MVSLAKISKTVRTHDKLNYKLWKDGELKLGVRVALLKIALSFYEFLDVKCLKVDDVVITGSNAAFNYTSFSDIDIHLRVSLTEHSECEDINDNLMDTKKNLWNNTHDINVEGYTVELYVEHKNDPVEAAGIYSLLKGKWLREPMPDDDPDIDNKLVSKKANEIIKQINTVLNDKNHTQESVDKLMRKIYRIRQAGLAKGGEMSIENLVFKVIRNEGLLDKLRELKTGLQDEDLSWEDDDE